MGMYDLSREVEILDKKEIQSRIKTVESAIIDRPDIVRMILSRQELVDVILKFYSKIYGDHLDIVGIGCGEIFKILSIPNDASPVTHGITPRKLSDLFI